MLGYIPVVGHSYADFSYSEFKRNMHYMHFLLLVVFVTLTSVCKVTVSILEHFPVVAHSYADFIYNGFKDLK